MKPHRLGGLAADLVLRLPHNRRRPRRRPSRRELDGRAAVRRAALRFCFDLVAGLLLLVWFGMNTAINRNTVRNVQRPTPWL